YAQMRNVYFIPSALALKNWLKKCGFVDIRIADVSVTTTEEQRRTEWMVTESLADFLDPHDPGKTVEGYPAPKRADQGAGRLQGQRRAYPGGDRH
ncbi:DUF1698 domain-containing protein, partial [Pseudomonas aeruginosa]